MPDTAAENNCNKVLPQIPWMYSATLAAMFIALSIFIVVANAVLLYSLYKTNQLTTITNKFMFLMSISDLVIGFPVAPFIAASLLIDEKFKPCFMEKIVEFLALLSGNFSFFMYVAIALDRYFHVTKLNRYQDFMNDFKMKAIVASSVVLTIFIAIMLLVFGNMLLKSVGNLVVICSVFMLYYKISRQIRAHAITDDVQPSNNGNARMQTRQILSSIKSIRAILASMLLLGLPYNIIMAIRTGFNYQKIKPNIPLNLTHALSLLLLLSNAGANAVIYGYSNSVNRRHIAGLFKRKRQATDEQAS